MNKKVIAAFVGLLVIIGVVAVASQNQDKSSSTVTPSPSVSAETSPSSSAAADATATPDSGIALITFNGTSFMPESITVKSGSQIRFTNRSDDAVDVDSDPHPAHTSNADLNVGVIGPGASKTVTVMKKGTYGIHDHLDSSVTGKITVE